MRRIIIIAAMAFLIFFLELVLFNIFGSWFKPNLLIILIVFVNLYLGIRYSIIAAILSGVIKDCFSVGIFGISIFSFVLCAYMTTFIRRYSYEAGSDWSRLKAIFLVTVINVFLNYMINVMFGSVSFDEMVNSILVPETFATLIVASYVFKRLKDYATRIAL